MWRAFLMSRLSPAQVGVEYFVCSPVRWDRPLVSAPNDGVVVWRGGRVRRAITLF